MFTGLQGRKDVALKNMLRKVRSFYWSQFNLTESGNKRRSTNNESYDEQVKFFIEALLGMPSTPKLVFTLGSMMSVSKMESCLRSSLAKPTATKKVREAENIHNTLYKFSMKRFKKLSKCPSFRKLIMYYESHADQEGFSNDEQIGLQMLVDM